MTVVSREIEVAADPERTWTRIADIDNSGDWNTVHVDFPGGAPGTAEAGKAFKEKVTIMGMPGEVDWRIDEAQAPRRIVMSGTGPMGTTLSARFVIEPNGSGTRITYETEFGGAAVAAMAGPLEAASGKAAEESLAKLKAELG